MRPLLLATLALCSTLPTPPAVACGMPAPKVFVVVHHGGHTLALLHAPIADAAQRTWTPIAPHSYDDTLASPAPRLTAPVELTLLGDEGTRVVSTAQQLLVQGGWDRIAPTLALDVGTMRDHAFSVALVGTHRKVAWGHVTQIFASTADRERFTAAAGVAPAAVNVWSVDDDVRVIEGEDAETAYDTSLVVRGDIQIGTAKGRPIGTLDADGGRYLLVEADGAVTTLRL